MSWSRRHIAESPDAFSVAFSGMQSQNSSSAVQSKSFEAWVDRKICPAVDGLFNRIAKNQSYSTRKDLLFIKPPRLTGNINAFHIAVGRSIFMSGVEVGYLNNLTEALRMRYEPGGYGVELITERRRAGGLLTLISLPDITPSMSEVEKFDITKRLVLPEWE
jgi:hypothetical protein